MKKHVPYDKLSKKAKKALDRKERGQWGDIRPVTRRIESEKLYNRKKLPHIGRDDAGAFCMCADYWGRGSIARAMNASTAGEISSSSNS